MSLLDVFYVEYRADTSKLDAAHDEVMKKTQKTSDSMQKKTRDSMKDLGDMASKSKDGMDRAAQGAERMGDAMKGAGKAVADAGKGVASLVAQIGGTAGGGFGGLGGVAGALRGLAAGPAAIGGVAIAVAAAATAYGIKAASNASDRYERLKYNAWTGGMNEKQLLMQQISGERIGITRGQTLEGLSGLHAKLQEVALHRASSASQGMQGDQNPLSRLLRKRGISITQGSHFRDMDKIWEVIVEDLRKSAERKGTNYALARATQQYGLNFEQADRIINASTSSLKYMNHELELAALKELEVALKVRILNNEKVKLSQAYTTFENQIASKTIPALTRLNAEFIKASESGTTFADIIGTIAAKCIDAVTWLVDKSRGLVDRAKSYDNEMTDKVHRDRFMHNYMADREKGWFGKEAKIKEPGWERLSDDQKKAAAARAWEQEKAAQKSKNDQQAAETRQKQLDAVVKANSAGGLTAKQLDEGLQKAMKGGWSADTLDTYFKDLIENQKRGLKAADAQFQTSKEMQKTLAQFVSVGLEQAIAMWAAGVGRQGGLGSNEVGQHGQLRSDFEKRSRAWMYTPDATVMAESKIWAARLEKNQKMGTLGTPHTTSEQKGPTTSPEEGTSPVTSRSTADVKTVNSIKDLNKDTLPGDVDPHVNKKALLKRANEVAQAEMDAARMQRSNEESRKAQILSEQTSAKSSNESVAPVSVQVDQIVVNTNTDDPQTLGEQIGSKLQDYFKQLASSRDGVYSR